MGREDRDVMERDERDEEKCEMSVKKCRKNSAVLIGCLIFLDSFPHLFRGSKSMEQKM